MSERLDLYRHIDDICSELALNMTGNKARDYSEIRKWVRKNFTIWSVLNSNSKVLIQLYEEPAAINESIERSMSYKLADAIITDKLYVRTTEEDREFVIDRFETMILRMPDGKK